MEGPRLSRHNWVSGVGVEGPHLTRHNWRVGCGVSGVWVAWRDLISLDTTGEWGKWSVGGGTSSH